MTRYVYDYDVATGRPFVPRGADPNYRGGYRGMRMGAPGGQAAYGWYRWTHERDLGGSGGFQGRDPHFGRESAYDQREYRRVTPYDWETRPDGGLRNPRTDRELIRGFNANSPMLHPGSARRYERDYPASARHPAQNERPRPGYANRGLSSSGYSEAWQHRPGHGSR